MIFRVHRVLLGMLVVAACDSQAAGPVDGSVSGSVDGGRDDALFDADTDVGGADVDSGVADASVVDASVADAPAGDAPAGDAPVAEADAGLDAAADAPSIDAAVPHDGGVLPIARDLTICINGAGRRDDGANPYFEAICRSLQGVVQDCSGTDCYSAFAYNDRVQAREALIAALDTNVDGRVDTDDDPIFVSILGYSWGGVTATTVAEEFLSDPRVAPARRLVSKLIILAAYSPLAGPTVEVVQGVVRFWSYRNSRAPADDCTRGSPLGPYLSLPPRCHPTARCKDHDYWLDSQGSFGAPQFGIAPMSGPEVDHCELPLVALEAILDNLRGQDSGFAPTEVPVAPL